MAQLYPAALVNGSEHLAACAEGVATPESLIELAKNVRGPMRCEWGAGTKDECGIILGSWVLLRKESFHCALPRCNQQFHSSYTTFVEHLDLAHLLRLTFSCPLPGCRGNSLRGIESLQKHLEIHNDEGEALPYPVDSSMTWMPVKWCQSLASRSTTASTKSGCSVPSAASYKPKSRLGAILVSSMRMKKSQKMAEWMQENVEDWLPSQSIMSQSQGLTGSQPGLHPIARRKRQAKQLEKMKEIKRSDDDEGVTKVALDDLVGFDAEGDLMGIADGHRISIMGQRQKTSARDLQQEEGSRDIKLIQKADNGMIIGQAIEQLMIDLSRPQPMLTLQELAQNGGEHPELARAPKTITFGVMRRKIDKLEALDDVEIDPDRLLHDPTL